MKTEITRDDILPMDVYGAERKERRARMAALKKNRRVGVGPHATFYFENYETMRHQIHEMLFIEKGGEEQIADELAAYNPLIPNGRELVATVMFEIPDEGQRRALLSKLGGVEETMFLEIGGEKVMGMPEEDVDRTTADGKASSVQFVHFPLTDGQAAAFRDPATRIIVGIEHPNYSHMAVLPEMVKEALADDLV